MSRKKHLKMPARATGTARRPVPSAAQGPPMAMLGGPRPFAMLYGSEPLVRIRMVREGIPAKFLERMSQEMDITADALSSTIGVPRATAARKVREGRPLSAAQGERALGLATLIGQVQTMVAESGRPEGFDAARWVARWLQHPHPALAGQRPGELMDTADGRALVGDLVARMQSGAYT